MTGVQGFERREHDGYIELRFDRPDKKNAVTSEMYRGLTAALAEATERSDIRCVVFAANGTTFCAGNDIQDFLEPDGAEAALTFIKALTMFGKPMVAAVNGLAVGIGTTMLLHCDLVYAVPTARFSVPFVKIGLVPEAASSLLLPNRIGLAKASAMLLLGEPIDAHEAERTGLITAIVDSEGLDALVASKVRLLLSMPPQALANTRKLIRGEDSDVAVRFYHESVALRAALRSEEAQAAFSSFLNKSPPKAQS